MDDGGGIDTDVREQVQAAGRGVVPPDAPPAEEILRRARSRRGLRMAGAGTVAAMVALALVWAGTSLSGLHRQSRGSIGTGPTLTTPCAHPTLFDRLDIHRTDQFPQNHVAFSFPADATLTDRGQVQTLLGAACALPLLPTAPPMSCPVDIGIDYHMTFTGPRAKATADANATGCQEVSGLGADRWSATTPAFWTALAHAFGVSPGALRGTFPSEPTGTPSNAEYSMTMPDSATPSGQKGVYSIQIATNLPAGTVVMAGIGDANGGGGATFSVGNGVLTMPLLNNACVDRNGQQVSLPTTLTITVAPNYDSWTDGPIGASPSPWQPSSVQAVLGSNFENLAGPQVTYDAALGFNELVAQGHYQLPNDTCIPNRP
jgi:hypothetical protein